jgi:hypothetical protein
MLNGSYLENMSYRGVAYLGLTNWTISIISCFLGKYVDVYKRHRKGGGLRNFNDAVSI